MLALVVAPADPGALVVTDADRHAIARLVRANVTVAVIGDPARRLELEGCAASLGAFVAIREIAGAPSSPAAFRTCASDLRLNPDRVYVVVDSDVAENAVRAAGSIALRLAPQTLPTLRDAVACLAGPILRIALKVRTLVAAIGVDD